MQLLSAIIPWVEAFAQLPAVAATNDTVLGYLTSIGVSTEMFILFCVMMIVMLWPSKKVDTIDPAVRQAMVFLKFAQNRPAQVLDTEICGAVAVAGASSSGQSSAAVSQDAFQRMESIVRDLAMQLHHTGGALNECRNQLSQMTNERSKVDEVIIDSMSKIMLFISGDDVPVMDSPVRQAIKDAYISAHEQLQSPAMHVSSSSHPQAVFQEQVFKQTPAAQTGMNDPAPQAPVLSAQRVPNGPAVPNQAPVPSAAPTRPPQPLPQPDMPKQASMVQNPAGLPGTFAPLRQADMVGQRPGIPKPAENPPQRPAWATKPDEKPGNFSGNFSEAAPKITNQPQLVSPANLIANGSATVLPPAASSAPAGPSTGAPIAVPGATVPASVPLPTAAVVPSTTAPPSVGPSVLVAPPGPVVEIFRGKNAPRVAISRSEAAPVPKETPALSKFAAARAAAQATRPQAKTSTIIASDPFAAAKALTPDTTNPA